MVTSTHCAVGEAGSRKLYQRTRSRKAVLLAALGTAVLHKIAGVPRCFSIQCMQVRPSILAEQQFKISSFANPRDISAIVVAAGKFDDMKVAELKALLAEKDLPVSGRKADLISRLEQAKGKDLPADGEKAESLSRPKQAEGPRKFDGMKVAELKALLAEKGLAVSGKKAELISRLEQADAGSDSEITKEGEKQKAESKSTQSDNLKSFLMAM
eukprot:TRINITY_DN6465_c0_g1_i1.p1 TRINITY_DN6465_c0_g1~~TRINITY_DN6465_c0_g1_i1.p1  ORF type:complete len:213 (+),score=49.98 TRINITY_DN6465_c0_g1_i1:107-745(+)